MSAEIHVGDIGTQFLFTIYDDGVILDVSGATSIEIVFRKPDLTTVTKDASLVDDGTDGEVVYVSVDGDLDLNGQWIAQVIVTLPSGTWRSDTHRFQVGSNL